MFGITPSGFLALIREGSDWDHEDDTPWSRQWVSFFGEASRFDERQLIKYFGEPDPVQSLPDSAADFDERDRTLVSLFVKRQHAKIVASMARSGRVPGPDGEPLSISYDGVPLTQAGMVARSLGAPIRATYEEVDGPDRREIRQIHPPYLMALLNLGSYFRLEHERAEGRTLPFSELVSPVLRDDLAPQKDDFNITNADDDPEGLSVNVIPESVAGYNAIRDLLDLLQEELDLAWGVVGEVYGPVPALRGLGFSIRRVRSNLDDPKSLMDRVPYVPDRIAFRTAGVELLKLLVRPLYGEHASIGVRELLQNGVDAIREYRTSTGKAPSIDEGFAEDVRITFDKKVDGSATLEILDRGVGMTLHTIQNYFLVAGASLRRSAAWRDAFVRDGKSTVTRSGRFGIGLLSAFLIGVRIQVWTRHHLAGESEGFTFSATIEDEQLDVHRASLSNGTRILIHIHDARVIKELEDSKSWDWFCSAFPKVRRINSGKEARQAITVPDHSDENWTEIQVTGYRRVKWSHSAKILTCNGIQIGDTPGTARMAYRNIARPFTLNRYLSISRPGLAIEDANGRLPLNLERTRLNQPELPEPMLQALKQSTVERLLSHLCDRVNAMGRSLFESILTLRPREIEGLIYDTFSDRKLRRALWFSEKGISFIDPYLFSEAKCDRLLVLLVPWLERPLSRLKAVLANVGGASILPIYGNPMSQVHESDQLFKDLEKPMRGDLMDVLAPRGYRVLLNSAYVEYLEQTKAKFPPENSDVEWINRGHKLIRMGDVPDESYPFYEAGEFYETEEKRLLLEIYPAVADSECEASPLSNSLFDKYGGPILPIKWS